MSFLYSQGNDQVEPLLKTISGRGRASWQLVPAGLMGRWVVFLFLPVQTSGTAMDGGSSARRSSCHGPFTL